MHFVWMAVITFVILQMSVFATTIYLHRCVTHRGVQLHRSVEFLMHLELMLFTGIIPREWAAVHRKHHHHSDEEGDPHSPRVFGMWTVLFGNYFLYRKETKNLATIRKYTPDYRPDAIDKLPRWIQNYTIFAGLAIFMLMFGWGWGLAAWAFHLVAYVLLNSSINSLCHMIGYRNFDNLATNIQIIALFTGGEGLHNNHHEFPTSARFALRGREIDLAWPVIRLLERCGLATIDRLPIAKAA
ncbi:MAG TPA: fatty acid desaturase [Bryobacteraceae bacterium]|nr:fatty acid desaturase [Bryobacteraceae bacterium]